MQMHLTSNAGSQESAHYQAIDLAEKRERAAEFQQKLILNEVQQGAPAACHAFAQHCANWLVRDIAYDLCLARIQKDDGLLQQATAELDALLKNTLAEFCEEEAERRLAALQKQAEESIYDQFPWVHPNE